MSDPIIEAAHRALYDTDGWDQDDERKVHAVLAAVTPLIRAAALEEAALSQSERSILLQALRIAEEDGSLEEFATGKQVERIVEKLRALKEMP
jgi:hypothetical protein